MNLVYHGTGVAAAGAGGLGAALFDPGSAGVEKGVGGYAVGGAPPSPSSFSRPMVGGAGIPPRSPANVSAAGIAPLPGARMGGGGFYIGGTPAQ